MRARAAGSPAQSDPPPAADAAPVPIPTWDEAAVPPPAGMVPLDVLPGLTRRLAAALRRGKQAANQAPADVQAFIAWAQQVFPPGPPPAVDRRELRTMHAVASRRTPAQDLAAEWLATGGDVWMWDLYLKEWQATVPAEQAAWGAALIRRARSVNAALNERVKEAHGRTRPYKADATLTTAVPRSSAASASYPSGHTARAFMDAALLAALMPRRAEEFYRLATQMAMSRIYGGVHYPTDTVAGAWEGGLMAAWMLRTFSRPGGKSSGGRVG